MEYLFSSYRAYDTFKQNTRLSVSKSEKPAEIRIKIYDHNAPDRTEVSISVGKENMADLIKVLKDLSSSMDTDQIIEIA